jgi:two-component system, cell cycle response regulator
MQLDKSDSENSMRNHCRTASFSSIPHPQSFQIGQSKGRRARLVNPLPRILLAEDDTFVRQMLSNWLEADGYRVEVAKDGEDAWRTLDQPGSPELVILDWMMPGIDGTEICRRLRTRQSEFYHYVLMITAKSHKQDIAFALEAGADDYLVKPFDLDEFRARLVVANRIVAVQHQLIDARESFRVQATKDDLTGTWNRVTFLDLFEGELDRASRAGVTTGLLMLDIDNFKEINDGFGHLTGDLALIEIAGRLKRMLRSYDFLGRYGGEEFLIALPGVTKAQLCEIAERIRLSIANAPLVLGKTEIKITLSIGAVDIAPGRKNPEQAIAIADVALYHAKNLGRNRTVACPKPWHEHLQFDGTAHSLCSTCHHDSATQCCVIESQSSHWASFKPREVSNMFPVAAALSPVGEARA